MGPVPQMAAFGTILGPDRIAALHAAGVAAAAAAAAAGVRNVRGDVRCGLRCMRSDAAAGEEEEHKV